MSQPSADKDERQSHAMPGDEILPSSYRKKPVVIQAIRWSGTNLKEVIDFTGLNESADKWTWEEYEDVVRTKGLKIFSLEGSNFIVTKGDYIIKGVKGEFYACKPDIFWLTYDRADKETGDDLYKQIVMDLHAALGVEFGEDPYAKIKELRGAVPECGTLPDGGASAVEQVAKEFDDYWYNDNKEGLRQMMLGIAADLDAARSAIQPVPTGKDSPQALYDYWKKVHIAGGATEEHAHLRSLDHLHASSYLLGVNYMDGKTRSTRPLIDTFTLDVCEELFGCHLTGGFWDIRCSICEHPVNINAWVEADHEPDCIIPKVRELLRQRRPECVTVSAKQERP